MATYTKVQQFVEDLAHGVHDLETDALTVALCATANAPVATNSILSDLTEISYTNVVTTPTASRVIGTPTSSGQTTGTYKLVLPDMTITATGGAIAAFQYVVIYNDTPSSPLNPLICFFDYGSALTLATGETLLIDFDAANGLLQIA